jgi:UDP-N-acetylglucosamine 2-epimerase (hydrolysing)
MKKIKIVFVTGTRADYGKLKSLMLLCDKDDHIDTFVYVTGMHLLEEYGNTYKDVIADGYQNIYRPDAAHFSNSMDDNTAFTILSFSAYVKKIKPDFIVVHGDRIEPLACSIVGVLNNIRVAHIEGGEITGTVDEFIRHAVSKLSSLHFVANSESKFRLIQLGEREENIYSIGSPDIDIMLSNTLPDIVQIRSDYDIQFEHYAILIYHPVTTIDNLEYYVNQVISAVCNSNRNYLFIYPNNDHGSDIIREAFSKLTSCERIRMFKSIPFEVFLVLLKNSEFILGNSSAGIREACVYGVPAIDIGSRQNKRYIPRAVRNIQHTEEDEKCILECINNVADYRYTSNYFGSGNSAELFLDAIKTSSILETSIQKEFVELDVTSESIKNYINEIFF